MLLRPPLYLRQPLIHDTSKPNRWADSLVGLVLTKREERWQQPPQSRNDRLPLCIVVCPQDGTWLHGIVRVVWPQPLESLQAPQ